MNITYVADAIYNSFSKLCTELDLVFEHCQFVGFKCKSDLQAEDFRPSSILP